MTSFDPLTTLLVVALEDELPADMVSGWRIIYTGVGKINAAIALTAAVDEYKPLHVLNYGSAGALKPGLIGIHEVTQFYQRDMDVRALGFALGQTPFEDDICIDLGRAGLSCGTGDQFVSAPPELDTDLVDMEAFALAKICRQQARDFHCFKYISDNADDEAANDWSQSLAIGARLFCNQILA